MRKCNLCGKGSKMGGTRRLLRGHYNPVNWSRKYPNLQWARVPDKKASAGWRRTLICTACMRSLHKTKKK